MTNGYTFLKSCRKLFVVLMTWLSGIILYTSLMFKVDCSLYRSYNNDYNHWTWQNNNVQLHRLEWSIINTLQLINLYLSIWCVLLQYVYYVVHFFKHHICCLLLYKTSFLPPGCRSPIPSYSKAGGGFTLNAVKCPDECIVKPCSLYLKWNKCRPVVIAIYY